MAVEVGRMITVTKLVKQFSKGWGQPFTAVDELSFEVTRGEVYGLLGANGAGKTTTLRMLSTLIQPTSGTVNIAGATLATPLEIRKRLAYVPAEAGLPDRLSPLEVVSLFARIQGVDEPHERARSLLDRLGASSYEQTPCGDLSTGMKRRVVLARALVHEPAALLLDEPTDGLDVPGRRDVLGLVREQAESGRAIVISSHIMSEVERVVDRVGVMRTGKLVAEGSLDEVKRVAGADNLDDAFVQLVE
jgi:sodium transport system ATP-binding protein